MAHVPADPYAALRPAPVLQRVWGWLAVGNFFLGGTAAAAYVLALLLALWPGVTPAPLLGVVQRLAPLLVLAGFGAVALEAGRPLRGLRVLWNLRHSWMSRELLAGLVFVLLAWADALWPRAALRLLAGLAALGLLVSQGLILFHARGVPAWHQRRVPTLFVSSGLLTGTALLLGLAALLATEARALALLAGLAFALAAADLGLWWAYLHQPARVPEVALACQRLRRWPLLVSTVGVGHLLPLLLLGSWLAQPTASPLRLLATSIALLLGGWSLKAGLVTKAGYLFGIPVPRLSGRPPAGGAP
ncbi:MAG: hypothetical protein KatS3mg131_1357 [Candidatus Tectimicrobiota bacterium]|nr:MAG: hypothetical protein KatS3mg131_1357 [Candidatus Tectomicrobia bacterium]